MPCGDGRVRHRLQIQHRRRPNRVQCVVDQWSPRQAKGAPWVSLTTTRARPSLTLWLIVFISAHLTLHLVSVRLYTHRRIRTTLRRQVPLAPIQGANRRSWHLARHRRHDRQHQFQTTSSTSANGAILPRGGWREPNHCRDDRNARQQLRRADPAEAPSGLAHPRQLNEAGWPWTNSVRCQLSVLAELPSHSISGRSGCEWGFAGNSSTGSGSSWLTYVWPVGVVHFVVCGPVRSV